VIGTQKPINVELMLHGEVARIGRSFEGFYVM
jgi:hypothetical protein